MASQIWNAIFYENSTFSGDFSYQGLCLLLADTFSYTEIDRQESINCWKASNLSVLLEELCSHVGLNSEAFDSLYALADHVSSFHHFHNKIDINQQILEDMIDKNIQHRSRDNLNVLELVLMNLKDNCMRKVYKKRLIELGRSLFRDHIQDKED